MIKQTKKPKSEKKRLIKGNIAREKGKGDIKPSPKTDDKTINPKLLKEFKRLCAVNDTIIKKYDHVVNICGIYQKNNSAKLGYLQFETDAEREKMHDNVFKVIAQTENIEGYILILDTYLTKFDRKNKKFKRGNCVVRTLYTPKKKIMEFVYYENKKILEKVKPDCTNMSDYWDYWNISKPQDMNKKDTRDFENFKRELHKTGKETTD